MTNLPAPSDLLSTLDLAAIESAILGTEDSQLLAHEFETAKAMVWTAAEKWLIGDLTLLYASTLGVEQEFTMKCGGYPVKGYLDLNGVYKSGAVRGKRLVADWKSTGGELDKNWETRLCDSWQFRTYAVATAADFISYRGVSTKLKTREVYIEVPPLKPLTLAVNNYYCSAGDMMRAAAKYDVWPQHKPSACGLYGSTCPFKQQCDMGSMPAYLIDMDEITLSYSGVERFLSCPEKYRRINKAERGVDGSDSTRLGSAFHSGLEILYQLAFKQYGED